MKQAKVMENALSDRGSLLIGLIITMVVMAVLGAGMIYVSSTSTFNELFYSSHSDAYYAAEAGGRYVKAVTRDAYANDITRLNQVNNNQTFTLANGSTFQITNWNIVSGNPDTVTFTSTGTVRSGLLYAKRQINYSIQPSNQTANGSGETISEPNMDNFVNSPQGTFAQTDDGAIQVTGLTPDVPAGEERGFAYYKNSSVDFSTFRSAQGGFLSYDAQVKVKSTTEFFLAGLGFRTHPLRNQTSATNSTDPRSIHISFLRFSGNDNTNQYSNIDQIPLELKYENWWNWGSGGVSGPLEIGANYIILWMDYGAGNINSTTAQERLLAYKKLDSTSGVFAQTYCINDNMEYDSWNRSATSVWSWVTNDSYSSTHSYYAQAAAAQTLQLTFWHKLDLVDTSGRDRDLAYVEICAGRCTRNNDWETLGDYLESDVSNWTQVSRDIPSDYINVSNVKIRFRMTTSQTQGTRTWYIDDVNIQDVFSDDMESGDGKWDTPYDSDWALVTSDYHSSTHSFRLSTNRNNEKSLASITFATNSSSNEKDVLISPAFNIPDITSAFLTFMHKLDIKSNSRDYAGVDICQGACTTWTSLGNFTTDTSGWSGATLTIPSAFLNQSSVKVRFRISTISTSQFPTWYIDDVKIGGPPSFTAWSTLLVRLEEKQLTASDYLNSSFPLGTRVNKIIAYYSTPTSNGSGNHPGGATDVNRQGSNPRGTLQWPVANSANDPNFTLIQWDWVRNDENTVGNAGRTIVQTKYYRTTGKGSDSLGGYTVTSEYDELGLSVFGIYSEDHVFFDDFAVKIGSGGGNDGTGVVIQYP